MASGPLNGVRIVEFQGIGPAPFCGMLMADLGADVVRIDRHGTQPGADFIMGRGKRSIAIDLKHAQGVEAALAVVEKADALIEGFRPGVMERLGLGPDVALKRNREACIRPHDRLGTDRPVVGHGGTRYRLHRADRRAAHDGAQRESRRRRR